MSFVVSSRTYVRDLIRYQHFIRSLPSLSCCNSCLTSCMRWVKLLRALSYLKQPLF